MIDELASDLLSDEPSGMGDDDFTDEALGLDPNDTTGEPPLTPDPVKIPEEEEPERTQEPEPTQQEPPASLLAQKGLAHFRDVPAALDAYNLLNAKIGEQGLKLGKKDARIEQLEKGLEELFETVDGKFYLREEVIEQYVRKKEIEEPELTHEEVMDELDADLPGTLNKMVETKLATLMKPFDKYMSNAKIRDEEAQIQAQLDIKGTELFQHYENNVPGFKENIKEICEILEDNPELYDAFNKGSIKDPLKIAMRMLTKADSIAAKKRKDGAFLEKGHPHSDIERSEEDRDYDDMLAAESPAGKLLNY